MLKSGKRTVGWITSLLLSLTAVASSAAQPSYHLVFLVYVEHPGLVAGARHGVEPLLLTDTKRAVFVADFCTYQISKDRLDLTKSQIRERYALETDQIADFRDELRRYCRNEPVSFDLQKIVVRSNADTRITVGKADFRPWNEERVKLIAPPPPIPPIGTAGVISVDHIAAMPTRTRWSETRYEYLLAAEARVLDKILPRWKPTGEPSAELANRVERLLDEKKGSLGTSCSGFKCPDAKHTRRLRQLTESVPRIHETLWGDFDSDSRLDVALRARAQVLPGEADGTYGWQALAVAYGNGAAYLNGWDLGQNVLPPSGQLTSYPAHWLAPQAVLRMGECVFLLTMLRAHESYDFLTDSADLIALPNAPAACRNQHAVKHHPSRSDEPDA